MGKEIKSPQEQSSYTVEQLVAVNPFNPELVPDLENYVNEQVTSQTYSLDANLCLLRLYQFEPERINTHIVARILIKALMAMPTPDFSLCLFLIPERVQMEEQFKALIVLSHYLETGRLHQFWDEAAKNRHILEAVPGFEQAIQAYASHLLSLSYQKVTRSVLAEAVNMDGSSLDKFIEHQVANSGWIVEKEDNTEEEDTPAILPYDIRLKEPHAAISGIVGSSLAAWITGRGMLVNGKKRSPISADAFGSACYTFQKGRFSKLYGDLTRVDARVDISSASALAKRIFHAIRRSSGSNKTEDTLGSPRLNLIFQQQVAGPIVFKVDSQFQVGAGKFGAQMEDLIYSLNYSLRLLESGKVVAWYSPKRKEGMIELRVFEF